MLKKIKILGVDPLAETLLAKDAMEKTMARTGRTVNNYHDNNFLFSDNYFVKSINTEDQHITFCVVGAHHQNDIYENKNKLLTNDVKTLLLHGTQMWPQIIDEIFWIFSIRSVSKRHNRLQVNHNGRMPNYILHGVKVEDIPVKSFHALFCLIYALDACLQSAGDTVTPKWEHLGHLPFHAGSVALVWNPTTE